MDLGVGGREVDALLPVVVDGESRRTEVALALLDRHDDGVEGVLPELDPVVDVVPDGPHDVHVDSGVLLAVQVLERREVGAGLDDEGPLVGEERGCVGGVPVVLVVVQDLLVQSVVLDALQGLVELVAQLGVLLGEDEPVLLDGGVREDVQDHELVGVGGHLRQGHGAVHDLAVGLAEQEVVDDVRVGLLELDVAVRVALGGVVRAGGAGLDGHDLAIQVIQVLYVRADGCHDDLVHLCVGVGEVDRLLPLGVYGEPGGADVALALRHRDQDGVERVGSELDVVAHVVADRTDDVHVDAHIFPADLVVERGEVRAGLDDQRRPPVPFVIAAGQHGIGCPGDAQDRDDCYHRDQLVPFHCINRINECQSTS